MVRFFLGHIQERLGLNPAGLLAIMPEVHYFPESLKANAEITLPSIQTHTCSTFMITFLYLLIIF